ncbi:Cob(I)yrinic acid a,c-diamide adenosyltransferase [Candidatus Hepatincolaceae symbiont of Richtersius coronifer]
MSKIYTKTGDEGYSTVNHQRLPKSDIFFDTLGKIDYLGAYLGMFLHVLQSQTATGIKKNNEDKEIYDHILKIQGNLMTISSYLAGYLKELQNLHEDLQGLEALIDKLDEQNTPLKNFIFPGGGQLSVLLHLIRASCRDCERAVVNLGAVKGLEIDKSVYRYINRLSDYFFVLARFYNDKGKRDIIWQIN